MVAPPKELAYRLTREACKILSHQKSTPSQRDMNTFVGELLAITAIFTALFMSWVMLV